MASLPSATEARSSPSTRWRGPSTSRGTRRARSMDVDLVPEPASLWQSTEQALATTEDIADRSHGAAGGRIRTMAAVINVETSSDHLLEGLRDLVERRGLLLEFSSVGIRGVRARG